MVKSHKEDTIGEIRKQIKQITSLDIDQNLIKAEELGAYKFAEREYEFGLTFKLLATLNEQELHNVPYNLLQQLNRQLTSLWGAFSAIKNFKIQDGNNQRAKDSMVTKFDEEEEKSTRIINEVIEISQSFSPTEKKTAEELAFQIKLKEKREHLEARSEEVNKHFEAAVNQVNEALSTINEKAKEFGISKYATIFDAQSTKHRNASFWWLGGTVVLLGLTIGYAFYLLYFFPAATSPNELVQMTITKVIIIASLFLGLSLCIKNFRAQKHNQILNRHRHNALTTFETFTAASTDVETKNAVLLEATRSIFANQTTGYHSQDSADSDFPSKIIEIVKSPKSA